MGAAKNTPWTPETLAKASKLWKEGKTSAQIVTALGGRISREAMNSKARTMRDLFPIKEDSGKNRKITIDLGPVAALWNDGKTSVEVAKVFGVKPSWVRSMAQQNRGMFVEKVSGTSRRVVVQSPRRPQPVLDREVQRMPLPASGTWKPIELDDYERERLPHALSMNDNTGCKYPLTDTGPHLFCAHTRHEMKPYCSYHVVKCNPPGAGTGSEKRAHKLK